MLNQTKNQKGFTILYALLISSLLLSIGLGIYDLSLRGFGLAAAASESQNAIFAADAGLECALYWDLKFNNGDGIFNSLAQRSQFVAPCGLNPNILSDPSGASFIMGGQPGFPYDEFHTKFTFQVSSDANKTVGTTGSCAIVSIIKIITGTATTTTIDSRGYNTCDIANPRRVERGLHTTY